MDTVFNTHQQVSVCISAYFGTIYRHTKILGVDTVSALWRVQLDDHPVLSPCVTPQTMTRIIAGSRPSSQRSVTSSPSTATISVCCPSSASTRDSYGPSVTSSASSRRHRTLSPSGGTHLSPCATRNCSRGGNLRSRFVRCHWCPVRNVTFVTDAFVAC